MAENRRQRHSRYPRMTRESDAFAMAPSTMDNTLLLLSGTPGAANPLAQANLYPSSSFSPTDIAAFQPDMPDFTPYGFDQAPPQGQQATNLDPFFGNQASSPYAPSYTSSSDPFDSIPSNSLRRSAGPTPSSSTSTPYYSTHPHWLSPPSPARGRSLDLAYPPHLSPQSQGHSHSQQIPTPTLDSSTASLATSATSTEYDDNSPTRDPKDLSQYGIQNPNGTWRCAYPGCSSAAVFRRGCDLRKHFNRHRKYLFCRYEGCPQAVRGGFSSKKDRDRHEAKHNPEIPCEWDGCQRVFSRMDNMKDHVRRIHRRHE